MMPPPCFAPSQVDSDAERHRLASLALEESRSSISAVEAAVADIVGKAHDEQLLALQERMHGLDEELHAEQVCLCER